MSLITITPWQLHKLQKEHDRQYYTDDAGYLTERVKIPPRKFTVVSVQHCCASRRRTQKRRGAEGKKQAAAGDGNSEGEPPRPLPFLDQAALADLLCISKKTLQNQYSVAPYTLPRAIQIPGARGPRWTPHSVQEWLAARPNHTPKPVPVAPKRKAGRPRIALAGKGGAA